MRRNGCGMRAGAAAAVAGLLLLLVSAPAWASESPRPRVAFDRQGGFVVQQGEEAAVTATLEGGSGGMWFQWEGNNAGVAAGDGGATFVIDTSVPGDYWLRAVGGSDGTDGDYAGKIRFRVAAKAVAAKGMRAAGAGETTLLSEDFSGMTSGSSTDVGSSGYNGWTGTKMFNGTNCLKIGNSSATGNALSPVVTNAGASGRVEYSLRKYGNDSTTVEVFCSTDGGASWTSLANHGSMPSSATSYSAEFGASQTVQFKWQGTGKRFHLGPVAVYATVPEPEENQPPTIDLAPDATEVEVILEETYSLEVTATEFDGDVVTLDASGLPDGAVWVPGDPASGSVQGLFEWTPSATGTWTTLFSATDKDGTTTMTVTFSAVPEGPGRLSFETAAVNARESSGSVVLRVLRTGGAAGAVGVAWATMDGTAAAGSEYVAGGGQASFADGQTEATVTVELIDDAAPESSKAFTVTLGNVTGGAEAGEITTCTVTIIDDDDANADYYANCYKNGVLKTGNTLKTALCQILNENTKTNQYGSKLNPFLNVVDACPTNSNQVLCIYLQRGLSQSAYNKEHIWPQSHGCSDPPQQGDLHHLRACDTTMNSTRGNKDFDNCQGKSGTTERNGCYYTSTAWEPPDAAKGDIARAVLYMDVRYEGMYGQANLTAVDSTGTSGNNLGKLSTLIAWNEADPPDDFERRRNELIYTTYQYNRNPFIDHPTWVRAVFDPDNFQEEAISWTVNVTVEGAGWVNNQDAAFTASVTNNMTKTFNVVPDASAYYHIGSISWNGVLVPQAYYTNVAYYNYTCPAVTNNSTLAVVFAADTASLGTPIWWLAQYGPNESSVTGGNWDAAELEDWNDDGVPNWQEYQNGTDPTALSLRQVTGVAVSDATAEGFTVSWNAVDYADGYRVRICETAVTQVASAGFEGGGVDSGWSVSESGAAVTTEGTVLDGAYWLKFSADGAWLCSPEVENPALVEFSYRRSSNTDPWTLAVEVLESGSTEWSPVGTVTDAGTSAKTASIDLSTWNGSTVRVRLVDARGSGTAARYVDAVKVYGSGGTAAEGTSATTSWTAVGLSAGTAYDVFVRAEATTLGEVAGPWSAAVRAATLAEEDTRQEQSIAFPEIADQTVGATVELTATASSGLAVEYAVDGPATIAGTTLTCTGAGTVTVTASQAGNADWKPAESVTRTFEVAELVLGAPENVRASATNAAGFTAEWSVVAGATGYELEVWKDGTGEDGGAESGTVLLSTNFASINGNGNTALNNGFIEGWTCSKAYGATNEIRVGASSALGWVKEPETVAAGTVRVVTRARAWSADANVVMWVGVTGCASQGNTLSAESAVFTNDFENVAGAVTVCWSNGTASKQRFFLEEVSVTELSAGAGGGGAVPVAGYDPLEVTGTSWAVTGLEAATAYGFHVRATAGTTEGGWSDAVGVTTLAAEPELLPQSIDFTAIGDQVATSVVTLSATVDSGLGVEFAVASGPAVLNGATLNFTGAGEVTVTATQAGNETYAPATASQTFMVSKAGQTITFPAIADQTVGATLTLSAAASSGLDVGYAVSGPATLENGVLTCTGAGTVTVTASQNGNDFYEAATPVERSFAVSLVPQTIDFATIGNQAATATVALSATASSGLEVSFAVTGGPAEVNGSTLTFTGAGEVTVTATQAGNTMYAPASASHTFTVVKASQTITFDAIAGQSVTDTVSLEATSSSGLEVSYTVSGPATLSGTSLSFTGAGTVMVTAHQPGNALWAAASDVVQEFAVSLLEQTIDFPEIAAQVATNTVALSATASSGLEVTFEVTSGPAVLDGNVLTFTGEGEVTVKAAQAGNESYEAATASQTFAVAKAVAEVTLAGLSQTYDGEAKAVTVATVPEGLAVVVTYDGSVEPPTAVGSYAVAATVEDAMWAGSVEGTLVIGKASQSIDFATIGDQIATNAVALSATASSGLEVTFEVTSGPAVLDGDVLSFTGSGSVVVTASQVGNESYEAATACQTFAVAKATAEVTQAGLSQTYDGEAKAVTVTTEPEGLAVVVTYDGAMEAPTAVGSYAVVATVDDAMWAGSAEGTLVIGKASQSIEFSAIGDQITTNTVALLATASSGLEVTFEVISGPASLDGNVLTFTGEGEVSVTASQEGNESYEAATASQTFTVVKATAEVTLDGLSQTYDGEAKAVTVMTDPEGLAVVVTYDGAMEAPTAVGSYAVVATVEDAMWSGSAEGTLVICKASQSIVFAEIGDQIATNSVALSATVSSGLEVTFEVTSGPAVLDGNVLSFTGSGTVVVTASQAGNESYEAATASQTFAVAKAVAEVTLSGLSQTYDGEAKAVTATTEPEGLTVVVTYDGNIEPPTAVGSYTVSATVEDAIWAGSAEGTLEIGKASQSIEFSAIGDQITTNTVALLATASSGLEVTFEVMSGPAVLDGNVLTFTGEGEVTVKAAQAGNESYESAVASQTFMVTEPEPEKSAYEVWLGRQGLSVADYPESSELDGDEDGVSNWAEYVADTDPSDSHEFFAVSVSAWGGDDLTLVPNPVSPERVYGVVYWTNMLASPQTNVLGSGFDSLSIETNVPATWFGTIRVGLP